MSNQPSSFIWYELLTGDVGEAAKFYGNVVGWSANDSGTPGIDYRLWTIGGVAVGGLMTIPAEAAAHGMQPQWLGYLNVDDVDASVAKITAAGGAVRMPAMDVPGIGRFATVTDPQGAAFYVMAPIGEGPSRAFEPGTLGHGGWHELHTTDWEGALRFYSEQFGWAKTDEMDMGQMGKYLLFNAGAGPIGGMFNHPASPQPAWLFYFIVDDIDAARSRVESSGGSIVIGPTEVPGGDWIIQGRDPQGAMFALVGPHKE